jgi:hypothetical protein
MELFGRKRGRINSDQMQTLSHPIRIGILGLFTKDAARSLAACDLLDDLIAEDLEMFGEFSVSQVAYHRALLQDAQLLPTE